MPIDLLVEYTDGTMESFTFHDEFRKKPNPAIKERF
jgi:hypothetical protein